MATEKITPHRVMLDIETLSLRADAMILSIGAVWITNTLVILNNNELFNDEFYCILEREMSQEGRHIDINTVEWWLTQDNYPKVHKEVIQTLPYALREFNSWVQGKQNRFGLDKENIEFWAKGTDFDITVLRDAYAALNIETPWNYNMVRDLRTFLKTTPFPYPPKEMNPEIHNALGDAKWQAMQLVEVLKAEVEHWS